jgi:exosortase A-associated hydrolase 2
MKKSLSAAKRVLRRNEKSILFFRSGDDARLITANGPWKDIAKRGKRAVVILPPFAEEMNRCRRLISLTQDALAAQDAPSISIDYFGTGDSAGEFGDARLSHWRADVADVCALAQSAGAQVITLLGFRFGALLAAEVARDIKLVDRVLAVAPQESLQRVMRQFVRIAATTQDFAAQDSGGLRKPGASGQLANGQVVEIGGYVVSPHLYADFMDKRELKKSKAALMTLFVGSGVTAGQPPSPPELRILNAMGSYSDDVSYSHVDDAQMWYQGIPEEPRNMPAAIAQSIAGTWPIRTMTNRDQAGKADAA